RDERTSPTWRPCSPPLAVHSYLTPHPETLRASLNGGNSSFARPLSSGASLNRHLSWIGVYTLTQAQESASLLLLGRDGELGTSYQGGIRRAETLVGPRPLDLNSLPSSSSASRQLELTSRPTETT